MNVLLISPPYDIKAYMGKLANVAYVFPPMGLLYIASSLKEANINVAMYDFSVDTEDFLEYCKAFNPDVVGITCQTALVYSTIELSKLIKKQDPKIKVVVGGVHVNLRHEDLLKEPTIDYSIRGEGEITMVEFVQSLDAGKDPMLVNGLACMDGGKIKQAPPRAPVKNIDDIPMPAIDMYDLSRYRISPDMRLGSKVGVIITSRGCPFDCVFCCNRMLTEGRWRAHSLERVFAEIDRFILDMKVEQLFFFDDNFCVNKKITQKICREYIKRGYHKRVKWWAAARVDCVDEETLQLMYDAGCRIISYGLESGSQRLLDLINKNITIENAKKISKLTSKIGISVRVSLILGLPTETREESLQTIEYAKTVGADQVRFAIATPFPGTKLWEIAVKEGAIDPDNVDWLRFSLMSGYSKGLPVYAPVGRSPLELAELQRRANFNFYFRPKTILLFAKRINSFAALKEMIAGAFTLIATMFSKN